MDDFDLEIKNECINEMLMNLEEFEGCFVEPEPSQFWRRSRLSSIKKFISALVVASFSGNALGADALESLLGKYSDVSRKEEAPTRAIAAKKVGAAEKPKPASATSSAYTLQLGSFATQDEAEHYIKNFKHQKETLYISNSEVNGKIWWRVQTGKFATNREATAYKKYLMSEYKLDSFVAVAAKPIGATEVLPSIVDPVLQIVKANPEVPVEVVNPVEPVVVAPTKDAPDYSNFLFKSWGGVKPYLSDRGIEISLTYKSDYIENFSGGINKDSTFMGNADVKTSFDFGKILGLTGLKLNLYALGDHGDDASEFVGDTFVSSNIEAPNTFKIYEVHFEQSVDDRFTFKIGTIDLNAIYYVSPSAGTLLNSTFGISVAMAQTGENGPSIFPNTSLAMNVEYASPNNFYFQTGFFNALAGDPDRYQGTRINTKNDEGHLSIWETGYFREGDDGHNKFSAGGWVYSKEVDRLDSSGTGKNSGFYIMVDKSLFEKLSGFVRYGIANETINDFESGLEVGLAYTGMFASRPNDVFAIGYAEAASGTDYKDANPDNDTKESVIELAYKFDFSRGLALTADYQIIQNPSLDSDIKDANVAGIRFHIDF